MILRIERSDIEMGKIRVVHYLNQFFGQIGGEDKASEGFSVKKGPVGPGLALQKELGDEAEIIATIICGDDYFSSDPKRHAAEGLKLLIPYKPDLFFAGPAFAAGRYSVACGAMCKAVNEGLQIPVITAMNEEVPGVDIYRKNGFIIKTGDHSKEMLSVIKSMVRLSDKLVNKNEDEETKLLTLENLPDPQGYNYFTRDLLRNVTSDKSVAERSVEMLIKKIKGEEFSSEVIPPEFELFDIPAAVNNLSNAVIAFVTDGGLVPKGNPDGMSTRSNLRWAAYDIQELFKDYEVVHAGYFNDYVLESPDRLVPLDALSDLVTEGMVGRIHDNLYSMPACTTVSKRCAEVGGEMAEAILQSKEVDAVILTST